jgi:hypothetical protein
MGNLNTFQDISGGNQNGLTGKIIRNVFKANVSAIQAYSSTKGTARYTLTGLTRDIRNLIGLDVTISGCTNAVNDGTFKVVAVSYASGYIYVKNTNAVIQAGAAGVVTSYFNTNALDVSLPSLILVDYDATVSTYDGNNNMLTCKFYVGGTSGTLVTTITMTYDINNNLLTCVRS